MTHLHVPVETIVNLVTQQLAKDNSSQPFYYDRQPTQFTVPAGHSFVITDVIVNPEVTSFASSQYFLVVITADGGRSISVRCDGHTRHLALSAGLVVPSPGTPSPGGKGLVARNTTFSSGPVEVQVLGYLVKQETGLGVGKAVS